MSLWCLLSPSPLIYMQLGAYVPKWKRSPYVASYAIVLKDGGMFRDAEYVRTVSG